MRIFHLVLATGLLVVFMVGTSFCQPQTIALQGQLRKGNGDALSGTREYSIKFFDSATGGSQIGGGLSGTVEVSNSGRFTINIVPPEAVLNQTTLYYELGIDSADLPEGSVEGADIFPDRVRVDSVLFATRSLSATSAINADHASTADNAVNADAALNSFKLDGKAPDEYWQTKGNNVLTTPALLGTKNNAALHLIVNDTAALKIDPTSGATNFLANPNYNDIGNAGDTGIKGAAILSGGSKDFPNFAGSSWDVVVGGIQNGATGGLSAVVNGWGNRAEGDSSFIGGGTFNSTTGRISVVGGGDTNVASGDWSVVGGGRLSKAQGMESTVSGGQSNRATGDGATVPGGTANTAQGNLSFAAGHRAKANHNGAFVWADNTEADFSSTGEKQFLVRASGGVGINKNNPAPNTLDVNGDIAFSGNISGKVARTDETAGLRIIRGLVLGTGVINSGSGFNVVRDSQGNYTINFTTEFTSNPAVVVTAVGSGYTARTTSIGINATSINTTNSSGASSDPVAFSFIAISN